MPLNTPGLRRNAWATVGTLAVDDRRLPAHIECGRSDYRMRRDDTKKNGDDAMINVNAISQIAAAQRNRDEDEDMEQQFELAAAIFAWAAATHQANGGVWDEPVADAA